MIIVDRRQGSGDLVKHWPDAMLGNLRFGDVAILGWGPGGAPWACGIEIKGLLEIVNDLHSGRFFGYQAPGLRRSYDTCWLIVEGEHTEAPGDKLVIPFHKFQPKVSYSTLLAMLLTITQKGGIHVKMTKTRSETLGFCQQLAAWWLAGYDSHHALDTFYEAPAPGLLQKEHSLLRLWLKDLRGIGWKRSGEAEDAFESARDMANAKWERFADIKGISEKMAKQIVERIQGNA
ncbi:hypothetical protein LCGC14_0723210 [marine sediment metagenome]|uniref:ERCC4 domain-containing protein n=1 Tax=marine sediment metagenome TaxID=412755 RepID=A0A0F9QBT8_9ZZZZ